jgi:hypothetical protein
MTNSLQALHLHTGIKDGAEVAIVAISLFTADHIE